MAESWGKNPGCQMEFTFLYPILLPFLSCVGKVLKYFSVSFPSENLSFREFLARRHKLT